MKTAKPKLSPAHRSKRPARIGTARRQTTATKRAHRRTYPLHKRMLLHPLSMFIFLCAGVYMAGWTYHAIAATIISSTIEAPALQTAATLETPVNKSTVTTSLIHVTGACPTDSYVAVKVNGAFNGVGWCQSNNTYSIATSLFSGNNTVAVQDYNQTDLAGPTTPGITVTYNPPALGALRGRTVSTVQTPSSSNMTQESTNPTGATTQTSENTAASTPQSPSTTANTPSISGGSSAATPAENVVRPLLLTSDFQFHTFTEQKAFNWDLDLEGGTPPYNVVVDWGDGNSSHLRFPGDPVFTLRHVYQTGGYYAVVVNSADTAGQQHVVQLAALITDKHGNAPFLSSSSNGTSGSAKTKGSSSTTASSSENATLANARWLIVAWPFYIVIILMTISFWLGEKRELELVVAHPQRKRRSAF